MKMSIVCSMILSIAFFTSCSKNAIDTRCPEGIGSKSGAIPNIVSIFNIESFQAFFSFDRHASRATGSSRMTGSA